MTKNKKIVTAILSLCLVASLAIGGTLAFLTDSEKVTNTFTVGDLDITIDEPNWDDEDTPDNPDTPEDETKPGDGKDLTPGDSKVKDPTVTAVLNNSYMRVIMTVIDNNETIPNPAYVDADTTPAVEKTIANPNLGKPVTDKVRLAKILQTVYFDDSYNVKNTPATANILPDTKYALADLTGYTTTNETDFTFVADKSSSADKTTGIFYYNYNQIFNQGDKVVLFSNIVIPTDWNQNDMKILGKYKIEVFAQAIQSDNFADANEAFAALDAEITAGTVQKDYGVVNGGK